jgi:hypothetical protein
MPGVRGALGHSQVIFVLLRPRSIIILDGRRPPRIEAFDPDLATLPNKSFVS